MKELSIIIPVYNVSTYIEDCLNSIYNQCMCLDIFEVIAINDGSTDNSLEILNRYAKQYSNLIILSQENKGLSATRNRGLSVATGSYIFFMDSDDFLCNQSLSSLLSIATKEQLDMLRFEYKYVNEVGQDLNKPTKRDHRKAYSKELIDGSFLYEKIFQGEFFCCLSLFKRSFLQKNHITFKEGIFFEDIEYALKVAYQAQRVMYVDTCIYAYRQRSTSITNTINKKKITDLIGICASLLNYLADPSLGNDFKKTIQATITNLTVFALMRISELESAHEKKAIARTMKDCGIHKLIRTPNLKEYLVASVFNWFGSRVVIALLSPLTRIKNKLNHI